MRAKIYLFLVALFSVATSWADRIDAVTARQVAACVVQRMDVSGQQMRIAPVNDQLKLVYTARSTRETRALPGGQYGAASAMSDYYVFNVGQNSGYVIVAGDDRVRPVLGYSDHGAFYPDSLPANMANWLAGYQKEISWAEQKGLPASEQIATEWQTYLNGEQAPASRSGSGVLLQTASWGQNEPYNEKTPLISGRHAVTGCVATAQAIIMRYHRYPAQASGGVSSYDGYSVNYETYDWNSMLDDYSGSYTQQQADAVAELMWHCGANAEMSYGTGSSGTSDKLAALSFRDVFGYRSVRYLKKNQYTWEDWKSMIRADLDAGCPILYSGQSNSGGHSFVCDGYTAEDTYHFNWGWDGYMNGYFILSTLDATGDGDGYCQDQTMIGNIRPDASGNVYAYRPVVTGMSYGGSYPIPAQTTVSLSCKLEYSGFENLTVYIGLGVVDAQGEIVQQPEANRSIAFPVNLAGWMTLSSDFSLVLNNGLSDGQRIALLMSEDGNQWELLRCQVGVPIGIGAQGPIDGATDEPNDPDEPVNVDLVWNTFDQKPLSVITDGATESYTNTGTYIWRFGGLDTDAWLRFVVKDPSWQEHLRVFWGGNSDNISVEGGGTQVDLSDGSWWIPVSNLSGSEFRFDMKILSDQAGLLQYDVEVYSEDKQRLLSELEGLQMRFVHPVQYALEPTKITGTVQEKIPFTLTLTQLDEAYVGHSGTLYLFFQFTSSAETRIYYVNDQGQEIEATYHDGSFSGGSGDYMNVEVPVEALRNDEPYHFILQAEQATGDRYQLVYLSQLALEQDVYMPLAQGLYTLIAIEEQEVQPVAVQFVPATVTGNAGEDLLFTIKTTQVDPKLEGVMPYISLNIEGSTHEEVEIDYIDEQNQRIPLNVVAHPEWPTNNLCITESQSFPGLTEGREYRFAFRYIGDFTSSLPEYGRIRIESMFGNDNEELPFDRQAGLEYTVNPKTTSTITVSGEMAYEDGHRDQHVVVASDGVYIVGQDGAQIQNLTVEEGGQLQLRNRLTVAGKLSVCRTVPDNCWITFAAPCDLVLENGRDLFDSDVLEARSGFISPQTQAWSPFDGTNVETGTALLLATSQEQAQETVWMNEQLVLPEAVIAETTGNISDGQYFKLQSNPFWENLQINGKAYVLHPQTNSFELEDRPVIAPFEAYMTASDELMNKISSLRLGGSATRVEALPQWGFRAWTENGMLCIETTSEREVAVYTLNGTLIRTYPSGQGIRREALNPGAYLVVCGGRAIKIIL